MKTPKHILFDWNGTLQDDVLAAVNGINVLLRKRSMPEVTVERHRELFSFPVRNYYLALGFRLENENWDAMAQEFIAAFVSDPSIRLFPGVKETLEALRAQGVEMSIITAAEESVVDSILRSYGIRDYFSKITGASDPGAGSKVERAKKLFASLGIAPEDACMVGDTTHDKQVADAIGCPCILLASGYESRPRLEQNGCPVLTSVSDLISFLR